MTKTHWIVLGVVVVAVIIAVIMFIRKPKVEVVTEQPIFPLKHGSSGPEVKQLQAWLIKNYGAQFPKTQSGGGVDGVWWDITDKNVKKFLNTDQVTEDFFKSKGIDQIKTS